MEEKRTIRASRPLPLLPHQRPRSDSTSNQLESDLSNDATESNENKMDFQSLKNHFEKQSTVSSACKNKRPSMPNPTTLSLCSPPPVPPKPTNLRRRSPVKSTPSPAVPPKARSSSPVSSVLGDFVKRFSITKEMLTEPDEEKTVKEIRELFDKETKVSFSRNENRNRSKVKIPSLDLPSLPLRPPPVPSKFILAQLHDFIPAVSAETLDSATGDSSLSSNPILSRHHSSDSSFSDEEETPIHEEKSKIRKCLEEVLSTEKTYVDILYVLSVKLSAEVKNTCEKDENLIVMFNNTYRQLLGSIQAIYRLHHETILPQFERFISGQDNGNMWTVLEKNSKFIETLYKDYFVKYDEAQTKLNDICRENPLINESMLKCQVYLGNLNPLTQLNCANQRLVRYILLMKTYLKYLDENSDDYRLTRSIHDELDRIALRCEEELVISPAQLNELNDRLENRFECFKSQRKFLWHGWVKKQSPRKRNDLVQRYLILFSDCILVCSEEFGKKFEIKRELTMKDLTLEILEGGKSWTLTNNDQNNSQLVYFPFRVNAVEKSYEFLTEKESERDVWVRKIGQASKDFNKKSTTIEIRQSFSTSEDREQLGKRAPTWVNDVDVSRCQICNNRFPTGLLSSRRHHCRCCGRCICGSCSSKRSTLSYCPSEGDVRVCDTCYTHLSGNLLSKNSAIWPKSTREIDETILFGDFRPMNSNSSVWIALQEDHILHVYSARLDQAEDYSIKVPDLIDIDFKVDSRTFILNESTKKHAFVVEANHQITFNKNERIDERMKNFDAKILFYCDLWLDAIRTAYNRTLPNWYVRKRDSADSGVNVG